MIEYWFIIKSRDFTTKRFILVIISVNPDILNRKLIKSLILSPQKNTNWVQQSHGIKLNSSVCEINSILKIVDLLELNAGFFDKNHIKYETNVVWLFEVKLLINSYSFCITNIDRLILFFFGCLWILWRISINIPWLSEYTVESLFRSLVENLFWPTLQNIVRQYVFIGICTNEIHVHTKTS